MKDEKTNFKKTEKMAALKSREYRLERRVYVNGEDEYFVRICGQWFMLEWLRLHGTEVELFY